MDIDKRLKRIIDTIKDADYQALIVGGAVRNTLLNLEVVDYDLATNASLSELTKLFPNSFFIYRNRLEWALKVDYQGFKTEISRFRIEADYKHQIPQTIEYVDSFKEDVLRRDFTINAIGYCLNFGYVDYVNGIKDLNNKIIRTIGKPKLRFIEDPNRILRALRLASTLNFKIEDDTLQAIILLYPKALEINSNHVGIELQKIISGDNFDFVYNQVPQLFSHISNNKFKPIKLKNRTVLKDKQCLFIYLRYGMKLNIDNDIYSYLKINQNIIDKTYKLSPLIELLLEPIKFPQMALAFITHGKDQVLFIVNILLSLELLSKANHDMFKRVLLEGYPNIDDLQININDINVGKTLKESYNLLKLLQKEVILSLVKNERSALLKRILEITDQEKNNI